MGEDKRWLRLFPESPTFLDRAVALGRLVADHVLVVGGPDRVPASPGLSSIRDRWPGHGPLGALTTAFGTVSSGRVVVLAIDYPMLQADLVRRLTECAAGRDAVVSSSEEDGRTRRHPLVGCYDAAICGPIASALFAAGERSVRALLDGIEVDTIPFGSVEDALSLRNVNTPGELAALRWAVAERDLQATRTRMHAAGSADANRYTQGSGPARTGDVR